MPRILLVEDDMDVRRLYRRYLSVDHEVVDIDNSLEAFELYKQESFDLVITDTRLDNEPRAIDFPYQEGIKLLIDILQYDGDAKVMVMSSVKKNEAPAIDNGALFFLNKNLINTSYFRKVLNDYL